jgi:hypothetical protein
MTDFSDFVQVGPNGRVWWRLEDAFKLGAGFVPRKDDQANVNAQLIAPDNRSKANERSLLGAFHDSRHGIAAPYIAIRSDGNFVSAHDFLSWLGYYLLKSDSSINFPAELARKVDEAERSHLGRRKYQSWDARLANFYDLPLANLPNEFQVQLRADMQPFDWDLLAADQRSSWAEQWDTQHDPARKGENEFWFDFFARLAELKTEIVKWESTPAKGIEELAVQKARLTELRAELSATQGQAKKVRPLFTRAPEQSDTPTQTATAAKTYIPYPIAMERLAEKHDATPHDLAIWVMCGPGDGTGLNAFVNDGSGSPQVFQFPSTERGNVDYLSMLVGVQFDKADIERFKPNDLHLTGLQLVERWRKFPSIAVSVEGFIAAKISESRLTDMHPISGRTQWTYPSNSAKPSKESAIFSVREVEDIELEDGLVKRDLASMSSIVGNAVSADKIAQAFRMDADEGKNNEWWRSRLADAADYGLESCRAAKGKPGIKNSSRWWPSHVAGWLVDKGHLSAKRVAASLRRHFPDCSEAADLLDPP